MNKIESYVDSVIPKNIPKSKQQKLRSEIEAHIFDRIDFYTEIGYDTGASIDKAIADMGEDEEVKSSIRNDFEELHFERTWWAVAVGILFLLANSWYESFCNLSVYDLVYDYALNIDPEFLMSAVGHFLLLAMFVFTLILYRKGLAKCLLGLTVANVINFVLSITSNMFVSSFTTDCSFNFEQVLSFVLDKYTSYIDIYVPYKTIDFILSLLPLIFFIVLKVKGNPKKNHPVLVSALCVIYVALATVITVNVPVSQAYFDDYYNWFTSGYDLITGTADELYSSVNKDTPYDEFYDILREKEYITVAEFEQTLSNHSKKQFRFGLELAELMLDDSYEIWICPGEYDPDKPYTGTYGFVYLSKGESGNIRSVGVGNMLKDVNSFGRYYWSENRANARDYFNSLVGGESETDIMSYYGKENGEIYGKLKTFDNGIEKTYYRVHLEEFGEISGKNDINIELWFESGVLKEGKLHYGYKIPEEGFYWDYITIAD